MLLKQDGCARRRSSGGGGEQLRQCRRGSPGGGVGEEEASNSLPLSGVKEYNSLAEEERSVREMPLPDFRLHFGRAGLSA